MDNYNFDEYWNFFVGRLCLYLFEPSNSRIMTYMLGEPWLLLSMWYNIAWIHSVAILGEKTTNHYKNRIQVLASTHNHFNGINKNNCSLLSWRKYERALYLMENNSTILKHVQLWDSYIVDFYDEKMNQTNIFFFRRKQWKVP